MTQIFNNDFSDKASICSAFAIEDFDGVVIYADYEYENYSGDAAVVFVNDGKLYWQGGSHCSCHGLENDGWDPTEISIEQLKHTAKDGYGKDQEVAHNALQIMEQFGHVEDPDALAAAVTLFFRH
jgi:hypothetical protein